eukprot:2488066-Rhodomonas_salina.1
MSDKRAIDKSEAWGLSTGDKNVVAVHCQVRGTQSQQLKRGQRSNNSRACRSRAAWSCVVAVVGGDAEKGRERWPRATLVNTSVGTLPGPPAVSNPPPPAIALSWMQGGKGRTGLFVCGLLLWVGLFDTAQVLHRCPRNPSTTPISWTEGTCVETEDESHSARAGLGRADADKSDDDTDDER